MPESPKIPAPSEEEREALEALGYLDTNSELLDMQFEFRPIEKQSLNELVSSWNALIAEKRFELLPPSQIDQFLEIIELESDESITARLAEHYRNIINANITEVQVIEYWQTNQAEIQACLEAIAEHERNAEMLTKGE